MYHDMWRARSTGACGAPPGPAATRCHLIACTRVPARAVGHAPCLRPHDARRPAHRRPLLRHSESCTRTCSRLSSCRRGQRSPSGSATRRTAPWPARRNDHTARSRPRRRRAGPGGAHHPSPNGVYIAQRGGWWTLSRLGAWGPRAGRAAGAAPEPPQSRPRAAPRVAPGSGRVANARRPRSRTPLAPSAPGPNRPTMIHRPCDPAPWWTGRCGRRGPRRVGSGSCPHVLPSPNATSPVAPKRPRRRSTPAAPRADHVAPAAAGAVDGVLPTTYPFGRATGVGYVRRSATVNVEPAPSVLRTRRSPPIPRARSRLIASPRPVPSVPWA